MEKTAGVLTGRFVDSTFVNETYHEKHAHYLHSHRDKLELLYIIEGNGLYYVNKHEYIVNAGNMVICNAGITHGESPLRNNRMISYCCVLDQVCIEGMPENTLTAIEQNPILYFPGNEVGYVMQAIHGIYAKSDGGGVDNRTCNLLANALLDIVYKRILEMSRITEWSARKQGEFISDIMDYLDKNYVEPITLESVAERFHMSQSAFSRFFKEETGISPLKYLLCRRLGEAQSLLMNTDLSIGEVGSMVGYYDSSHFSAMFRKHTGLTPSQYRNHFLRININ